MSPVRRNRDPGPDAAGLVTVSPMTNPSPVPARSATRREGDGRAAAVDDMVDQYFDLLGQILDFQRQVAKSSVGWFNPFYSIVDEATRATRDAMSRAD